MSYNYYYSYQHLSLIRELVEEEEEPLVDSYCEYYHKGAWETSYFIPKCDLAEPKYFKKLTEEEAFLRML